MSLLPSPQAPLTVARARAALGNEGYATAEAAARALADDNAVAAMKQWLDQLQGVA